MKEYIQKNPKHVVGHFILASIWISFLVLGSLLVVFNNIWFDEVNYIYKAWLNAEEIVTL